MSAHLLQPSPSATSSSSPSPQNPPSSTPTSPSATSSSSPSPQNPPSSTPTSPSTTFIYNFQHKDPHTFSLYLTFATGSSFTDYDSYVVVAPRSSSSNNENNKEQRKTQLTTQWAQLAQAYILNHQLSTPSFRNAAIDALITNTLTLHADFDLIAGTGTGDIELVFSNTKKGDPLRRLVLDAVVGLASEDWEPNFERWWKVCFKEFLVEWGALAHRLCRKKGDAGLLREGDLRWRGKCAYHVHEGKAEDYCCADYWGMEEVVDGTGSGL